MRITGSGEEARDAGGFGSGLAQTGLLLLFLLGFAIAGSAQDAPDLPPRTSPHAATEAAPPKDAAPTQDAIPQSQAPDSQSDGFVFKKKVEEIALHAIVVDPQNRLVTGLPRESFTVFEDGKPQKITSFRKERVPIALGILIDNSSSMLSKRARVNDAALRLVDASQDEDRVFVVNFGDDAYLDQDYTQDVGKLRAALQRIETRGSTALYDAIIAAADHLNQTSTMPKKVLLVVTDGRDNASQATFQQVLRKLQEKDGPTLYTIALSPNESRSDNERQSLRTLSEQTGGTAFFPSSVDEIQSIASSIARDIRSQYVIGYSSSNPHTPGVYHSIHVQALEGSTQLRVATRTGYYSGSGK